MAPGVEKLIAARVAVDPATRKVHQVIMSEAGRMLNFTPVERVLIGERLLNVSRESLRRLFFLAYAYRMTGDVKYAARAEREMLAIAAFSDWHPAHFLDVGEMTMAMAIGYDWTFNALAPASRSRIRDAIITKGIDQSLMPSQNYWLTWNNNWNQVNNAGMSFGAMAIYEDDPTKAKGIIIRAVDSLPAVMQGYQPDGAYPEGYGYWGYGTSFNVMLVSAFENAFGTSFGLSEMPGFLQTPEYLLHMVGPSGEPFNYSDSDAHQDFDPAMFWFAERLKAPSLLWQQGPMLSTGTVPVLERLLPALMLWLGKQDLAAITAPTKTMWTGQGLNPVALMRTSWTDAQAIFVGIKAGSPSNNHGHMDGGSFVMDADGVRWAMDLGAQDYYSLESKGVDLWTMSQTSQRWQVYRLNNLAHNTLTVNGQFQRVAGKAYLTASSSSPTNMSATIDMTELYSTTLRSAVRKIAIVDKAYVSVTDSYTGGTGAATMRWTMVTRATVQLLDAKTAQLTLAGKVLRLYLDAPSGAVLSAAPATPLHDYDAPNPGVTLITFETPVSAGVTGQLRVRLVPIH